jgi:hypothetical protein
MMSILPWIVMPDFLRHRRDPNETILDCYPLGDKISKVTLIAILIEQGIPATFDESFDELCAKVNPRDVTKDMLPVAEFFMTGKPGLLADIADMKRFVISQSLGGEYLTDLKKIQKSVHKLTIKHMVVDDENPNLPQKIEFDADVHRACTLMQILLRARAMPSDLPQHLLDIAQDYISLKIKLRHEVDRINAALYEKFEKYSIGGLVGTFVTTTLGGRIKRSILRGLRLM